MVNLYSLVSLLSLVPALVAPSPDSARHLEYVFKGQEINFLPSIPGKPDRGGWIHEGRDVVWFDLQTGKEDVSPSYKDRITLEQESARLTIKDATYEDSGNYDLKLMINDQHHCLKYRIEIIEPFENTEKRIPRSPCNAPDVSLHLKYVLKGQEINFKPPIPEKPDLIIWFYHDVRGVVLFYDMGELKSPSYEDRIILNHRTAELTINNATYEDSGIYTLSWSINNEECRLKYPVEVINKVTKPNISCEMVNQKQAFLECLTEGKSDPLLKFKWRSQGTEQTGPILKINPSDEQHVYHCDVSNPLTNETASFLVKDCFLNKIQQDGILISTDMNSLIVTGIMGIGILISTYVTLLIVTGIMGIMLGFILGYIVRRKFQCSELFKIIQAKCFERQETTEAASPNLPKEKGSFESEPQYQPPISQEKQNLGSVARPTLSVMDSANGDSDFNDSDSDVSGDDGFSTFHLSGLGLECPP